MYIVQVCKDGLSNLHIQLSSVCPPPQQHATIDKNKLASVEK